MVFRLETVVRKLRCAAKDFLLMIQSIGAKPNLYCEAIELVCGGSPKVCVLVEWKALDRVKLEL